MNAEAGASAFDFDGTRPIALVTGGAKRVGRAISEAFAQRGLDVLFTFRSSDAEALATVRTLERHSVRARCVRLDFDEIPSIEAFVTTARASLPRLDVLVHNASIYGPSTSERAVEDAARHFRVNALAPLSLSLGLAPLLRSGVLGGSASGGAIVAMTDMHALGRPRKAFAPYSMSKAALLEMVRTLARDLAPSVRVNAVAPGVVLFPDRGYESDVSAREAYVSRVPLGRPGTPEEAAEVVRWLAMDAGYVTGEEIRLDGGRWLA